MHHDLDSVRNKRACFAEIKCSRLGVMLVNDTRSVSSCSGLLWQGQGIPHPQGFSF